MLPSLTVAMSILLVVLPLWLDPVPQLIAFAVTFMGVPVYVFFVMEKPWQLRPKIVDWLSNWLTSVTSKLFNTKLADPFES